jgi:hypothetical protein
MLIFGAKISFGGRPGLRLKHGNAGETYFWRQTFGWGGGGGWGRKIFLGAKTIFGSKNKFGSVCEKKEHFANSETSFHSTWPGRHYRFILPSV